MSRSVLGLCLVAGLVSACASPVAEHHATPQQASPNDPGRGRDDWFDEGHEETPGGGGDAGVPGDGGGGSTCASGVKGWRSMAPYRNTNVTFASHYGEPVWSGTEAFFVGAERYTAGCSTGGVCERTVAAAYKPATNTWRTLPSPWPTKFDGGLFSVWTGSTWLVHGGFTLGEGAHEGYEYDPTTNAWTKIPEPPIKPLFGQTRAWSATTKEYVVWGGKIIKPGSCGPTTACEYEYTNLGAAYSTVTKTWRAIAPSPLSSRVGAEATWDGRRIVVAWGWEDCDECEGRAAMSGVAAYDAATNTWEKLPEAPVVPRLTFVRETIGASGNLGALWGGHPADGDGDFWPTLHDGAAWDGAVGGWHTITDPGLPGDYRMGHASWSGSGKLFVWGGEGWFSMESEDYRYYADGAMWDPATRTWTMLPPGGPSARSHAAAVWTGCEAIVYGGRPADLTQLHAGKIYRP